MRPNPAVQIISWCLIVYALQQLPLGGVLFLGGGVFLFALVQARHKLIQLLQRSRWIMLTLLLIYSCSTPGQPVLGALGMFSPTREGLQDGLLQLTRLLAALAGLAILLNRLPRQQLISGLYKLFAPLCWLGLSRERIAIRLALTLQYGEAAMLSRTHIWQDHLYGLFEPQQPAGRELELHVERYNAADALLLGCAFLFLVVALR